MLSVVQNDLLTPKEERKEKKKCQRIRESKKESERSKWKRGKLAKMATRIADLVTFFSREQNKTK